MAPSRIGHSPDHYWLYDPDTNAIDLAPDSSSSSTLLTLETTTYPIRIDTAKTALLVIDMQNFFLSPELGRSASGPGLDAVRALLRVLPAARTKGIRIVWVNWGLTEEEVLCMPPGMMKAFRVFGKTGEAGDSTPLFMRGLGADIGTIQLKQQQQQQQQDGTQDNTQVQVEAGRALMRDTWNAALYGGLDAEYRAGRQRAQLPDVWIHKNRMSALWGARTDLQDFLEREGLTTLLFAGVNTDQCVGGTLTDAFSKGYNCILLSDAAATDSPQCAADAWLWNCANTFGFTSSCDALVSAAPQ